MAVEEMVKVEKRKSQRRVVLEIEGTEPITEKVGIWNGGDRADSREAWR